MRFLPLVFFCIACSVTSSSNPTLDVESTAETRGATNSQHPWGPEPAPINLAQAHFYADMPSASTWNSNARYPLELDDFDVSMTTAPGTLRTRIDAVIRNPSRQQMQARIRIPIPANAAVTEAILYVNDKPMRGAFLGAARAKTVYESYKQRRRDPLLAVWDGPDWVDVQIFPINGQQTRRFQLEWVEPRVTGGALHRVPLLADKGNVLRASGEMLVDGEAVQPVDGMILLEAPASTLVSVRRPGAAFGYVLAPGKRPSVSAVVLVAETSAHMTLDYRAMQRRHLESVLTTLPAHTRVTLLSADWLTRTIAEDKSPEEVRALLPKLDDIISAGALDIGNTIREATLLAKKTDAHAMVFFGQGESTSHANASAPSTQALHDDKISLFVIGPKGVTPSLKAMARQSGGRVLFSRDPLLAQFLQGHGDPPEVAGVEGWTLLASRNRQPMWMGRFLGGSAMGSTPGAAADLEALWVRSQVYVHGGDENRGEAHGVLTPSTSILVLESDAEYLRWGIPVPRAVPFRQGERTRVASRQDEPQSVAGRQARAREKSVANGQNGTLRFFQGWGSKAKKQLAKEEALGQARRSGHLGRSNANPGAFAQTTSEFSAGIDDRDIYGGLLGNEAGEMSGGLGYGISGVGPGGGGTGWGTIGAGNYGRIGAGPLGTNGSGSGSGVSRGRVSKGTVPQMRIGNARVSGGLDKNIIRRYIRRHLPRLRFCFEKELVVVPDFAGTVVAQFQIAPSGRVQGSRASGTGNRRVESCVASAIGAIQLPKPKGGAFVNVTYPFTFEGPNHAAPVASPLLLVLAASDKLDKDERVETLADRLGVDIKSASMLAWWILKEKVQEISTPVAGLLLAAQLLHDDGDDWNARRVLSQIGPAASEDTLKRLRDMGFAADADRMAGM